MTVNYLGIDWGQKRVGLARGNSLARLAQPLPGLPMDDSFIEKLKKLVVTEDINELVVGLPRNLDGEQTAQSSQIKQFAKELGEHLNLPVHLQDETLTSQEAATQIYKGIDVHSKAAGIILQDYLGNL